MKCPPGDERQLCAFTNNDKNNNRVICRHSRRSFSHKTCKNMSNLPIQKVALHSPPLEEIALVLKDGLKKNFADVEVCVVDCPDLTQKPFMLAATGLCGSPCLADVGGVPYLIPTVQKDKYYNLEKIAWDMELPSGFLVGAGAGPHRTVGVNCELMVNIKTSDDKSQVVNETHIAKVNQEDNSCILQKATVSDCALLVNLFGSEGKPGKVLQVKAKKRSGPVNFVTCMRNALRDNYGDKPVGMGGVFVLQAGKAKLHIMPDFSCTPLNSDADVENWLNFYDMPAPLVGLGQLTSHDPNLDLRIEHFHCFSDHGVGGHYHYDVTPDEVEYLGYFNIGEYMYRIDRPSVTHKIGRD